MGEKENTKQQVYLIKKEEIDNGKRIEFLNYVINDYSAARKTVRQIINKMNMRKSAELFTAIPPDDLFKEISPDVWIDGKIKFSIEVFLLKDVICPQNKIVKGLDNKQEIQDDIKFVNRIKKIDNCKIILK